MFRSFSLRAMSVMWVAGTVFSVGSAARISFRSSVDMFIVMYVFSFSFSCGGVFVFWFGVNLCSPNT